MASIIGVNELQHSNGTTAATIASDGKVTLPQHLLLTQYPHFEANLSSDQTNYIMGSDFGVGVKFNNTIYNIGNHFQTSGSDMGLFVVPVDGVYYLDAGAIANTTMQQSWFTLNNGRMPRSDWVKTTVGNRVMNKITLKLSANDKVGFHPYKDSGTTQYTISSNTNHTWFRGGLLQAL